MLPPELQRDRGVRLAHIGVAVGSLEEAAAFFRDVLGLVPGPATAADGATVVSLAAGGATIELLGAAAPDSPIGRYLERHGPGIHHVCFRVPDLEQALGRCRAAGYRLIDELPRAGADGRRIAFVHPKATAGILIELSD